MENEIKDPKPNEVVEEKKPEEEKETLSDVLGGGQSANKVEEQKGSAKPEAEKPKAGEEPKEEKKPEDNSESDNEKKGEEGKDLFWGKFKDEPTARKSYEEAQNKITEQGQELSEIKKEKEESDKLLATLDGVLESNPDIAEAIKKALAGKGKEEKPEAKEENVEETVEKILERKEAAKQTKIAIDKWFEDHPDVKEEEGKLGHAILDEIDKEGYPLTVKTLQTVYDSMTKNTAIDKAKKDALKEIGDGDIENGSKVVKEGAGAGKKPKEGTSLNDLIGGVGNANRIGK